MTTSRALIILHSCHLAKLVVLRWRWDKTTHVHAVYLVLAYFNILILCPCKSGGKSFSRHSRNKTEADKIISPGAGEGGGARQRTRLLGHNRRRISYTLMHILSGRVLCICMRNNSQSEYLVMNRHKKMWKFESQVCKSGSKVLSKPQIKIYNGSCHFKPWHLTQNHKTTLFWH